MSTTTKAAPKKEPAKKSRAANGEIKKVKAPKKVEETDEDTEKALEELMEIEGESGGIEC